ncbi:shisa family member 2a [Salvelinus fontinalis]|uniref:shisa family member 2a n=1 Tax=Salvelinus fontinalis TaxID=8038 RepID=UPI002486C351|nr:shisa family member 2a [Salvelinus fontinalis]
MRFLVALYLFFSLMHKHIVASSGEYCHGWSDSYKIWHKGFQCPEQYDGQDAKYCCGTCALRYCCTAVEARLDQSSCDLEEFFEFENDNTINMTQTVPAYLPFVIVVSTFLSFVLLGTIVSICCCQCLKPKAQDRQNASAPFQTSLLESGGPSPESMTPSRQSSSSSTGRSTLAAPRQPTTSTPGTDVNVNMYVAPLNNGYPVSSTQSNQYLPHPQPPGPFYQPYLNYGMPPEHTLLMAPFLENRSMYGHQLVHSIPQAPMHTEQLYTGVTI